jgi:hypothetical protein
MMSEKANLITMKLAPLALGFAGPWSALKSGIGAQVTRIRSTLSQPSTRLLDLTEITASCQSLSHSYAGVRQVPLHQILGSASSGRSQDFDVNFRPKRANSKERCQNIFAARQRGVKLPPVILIQVGNIYFVEDGHHRISVAHAWGEQEIEAEVKVWQVAGRLPWEA